MSAPGRTDESRKYVFLPHLYYGKSLTWLYRANCQCSCCDGVPPPVLATGTPPKAEYSVDRLLSDVVVDRPILVELSKKFGSEDEQTEPSRLGQSSPLSTIMVDIRRAHMCTCEANPDDARCARIRMS
jgi:hypothetical protein